MVHPDFLPVGLGSVVAVAVKVEDYRVGAGQGLHAAAGLGGQHVPRPHPVRMRSLLSGDADVEVTRRARVTVQELGGVREVGHPGQRRELHPVEEDQVLQQGAGHTPRRRRGRVLVTHIYSRGIGF